MDAWNPWIGFAIAAIVALGIVGVIILAATLALRAVAHRRAWAADLAVRARHPFRLLVVVIALGTAVVAAMPRGDWTDLVNHAFLIAAIIAVAWVLGAVSSFAIGVALGRYRVDVPDNRVARRMQTQLAIIRRLALVVIVVIAVGAILLTFPGVQAVGASLLASAGVASIVAGLAAQSTLTNVFAGVQLAFSDAIRVDDVVIAEGEWGRIEEITLTYVVVHIWDDRRLVLPSTYFTTTPFENWTRHSSELLGSVEFDLDWRVSPARMREELAVVLERTPLWDGRASVLQVTDAVGGAVRVRILVTAIDAPTLFDLRCFVREELVEWMRVESSDALPVQRVQLVAEDEVSAARVRSVENDDEHRALFSGTPEAEERASHFTTSIPIVEGRARD